MAKGRIRHAPGSAVSPWLTTEHCQPLAVPAEEVAAHLDVTVEEVLGAGVEPYVSASGVPLISVHQTAVALGLRRSRIERQRKRNGGTRPADRGSDRAEESGRGGDDPVSHL
jgi:hypothetical protein